MTGPTHVAFSLAIANVLNFSMSHTIITVIFSIIPDLDTSMSNIGKLLYPISVPLNKKFGHRKFIHSFTLWVPFLLLAYFYYPFKYVAIGAISHVLLDCWNLSGVEVFQPFSERTFVLFGKGWRIKTGSKAEIIIFLIFMLITFQAYQIQQQGGFRVAFIALLNSYKLSVDEHLRQSTLKCSLKGNLRYINGETVSNTWLVIGKEGGGLAILDKDKILHVPTDAEFLEAELIVHKEHWKTINLDDFSETETEVFMYSKKQGKWVRSPAGSFVSGSVIGDELKLKAVDILK